MRPWFGRWPARGGDGVYEAYRRAIVAEYYANRRRKIVLALLGCGFVVWVVVAGLLKAHGL